MWLVGKVGEEEEIISEEDSVFGQEEVEVDNKVGGQAGGNIVYNV